jgi:TfoX/Sxy family transcriptional regulator of competence genes
MPCNPSLDDKLRQIVSQWPQIERQKMFGGTSYLLQGNMVAGVYRDLLVLRVGQETERELLARPWCRPMDITGKPMKGWLFVEPAGWDDERHLGKLVNLAKTFADTLPPK